MGLGLTVHVEVARACSRFPFIDSQPTPSPVLPLSHPLQPLAVFLPSSRSFHVAVSTPCLTASRILSRARLRSSDKLMKSPQKMKYKDSCSYKKIFEENCAGDLTHAIGKKHLKIDTEDHVMSGLSSYKRKIKGIDALISIYNIYV